MRSVGDTDGEDFNWKHRLIGNEEEAEPNEAEPMQLPRRENIF